MQKFGVITSFLGQTRDRFHVYNAAIDLEQKLSAASSIPGYDGVEIVYPYEVDDPEETSSLLQKYELGIAAVNVNVKGEPEFVDGGLTSADSAVRSKAVKFIKEAKDFAAQVGAPHVTCCPLSDGFEFVFQSDYELEWKRLANSIGEAADYRRDEMPLFVEYKPKETRRVCYLSRAADTICLIRDMQVPGTGITIDYGHSIYSGESPSQALNLIKQSGIEYYIHINDNDKTWDWDFFCGSHTLLEYIEFIYYVMKFGYDRYMTSDTHPTRWNIQEMFAANVRLTRKVMELIETIGLEEFDKVIHQPDYMKTWAFIEERILRL